MIILQQESLVKFQYIRFSCPKRIAGFNETPPPPPYSYMIEH
jgi:hypothetical protein